MLNRPLVLARRGYLALGLLLVTGLLTACGTHGDAPALPQVANVALTVQGAKTALGTVTLTPIPGGRIVAYLGPNKIPFQGASNPVQLREYACNGPFIAPLTANATTPPSSAGQAIPDIRADPAGGTDIALQPNSNWEIVVLNHAGDPNAKAVACGGPLSDQQQYFDLYPPSQGVNGSGRGMALLQPQNYTRVAVSLAQAAPQRETWAVHSRSCVGPVVATGSIEQGARTAHGTIFAALDSGGWWVSVGTSQTAGACGQVA